MSMSKSTLALFAVSFGLSMAATMAAAAEYSADLRVTVMLDVAKEGSATDAVLGFYTDTGKLKGVCKSNSQTHWLSDSQSHWLSNKGASDWQCDLQGGIDGDGFAVFASQEHVEIWRTAVDGDLLLYTPDGDKAGSIVAFDVDGSEPLFFDIDGEQPTWFDIDGTEPVFFDIDGEQPTWLDGKRTWPDDIVDELMAY